MDSLVGKRHALKPMVLGWVDVDDLLVETNSRAVFSVFFHNA